LQFQDNHSSFLLRGVKDSSIEINREINSEEKVSVSVQLVVEGPNFAQQEYRAIVCQSETPLPTRSSCGAGTKLQLKSGYLLLCLRLENGSVRFLVLIRYFRIL
jgi:hypothetical protein